VENSLGRLWLLNRPASMLAAKMDYYIAPVEPETDFLRITRPEDIRICDPACGSGHMLTYAFDLLYAIYEEEGYEADTIPALILTHNLTGVEIDDRAGALAAFALAMKAAARLGRRRFLRMGVTPDICVLQNVAFTPAEMQDVAAVVGRDLFTGDLRETLGQFEQARNFGSLIVPKLRDPAEALRVVMARDFTGDLLLKDVQARVVAVLHMAEALSPKYHVVVANPPYMGGGGMNPKLKAKLAADYPMGKSDLMTSFIQVCIGISKPNTYVAMVTLDAWMFLSSYEKVRSWLLRRVTLTDLLHVGWNCFPEGHVYNRGTAFVLRNVISGRSANFIRLSDAEATVNKNDLFSERIANPRFVFHRNSNFFKRIPGQVFAYFASEKLITTFDDHRISQNYESGGRCKTSNDEVYLRKIWEVGMGRVGLDNDWCLLSKGGDFRRHYGNIENVIRWDSVTKEYYKGVGGLTRSKYWPRPSVTWSLITAKTQFAFRFKNGGIQYNTVSPTLFGDNIIFLSAFLNSKVCEALLHLIAPTLAVNVGEVLNLPLPPESVEEVSTGIGKNLIFVSRFDWDAYENSWDFATLPLLHPNHRAETLDRTYTALRSHWQGMTEDMQRLEEENNRIFIDAYGLQDELTPEVPLNEITLTCNPAYRYGVKGTEADRETRLRADTVAEYLSYAVGCMFGRYSLNAPGLILANQGETLADYLARIPDPSFMPDKDNVIPVLDADWFADDITDRFRQFLRVSFGEDTFRENLRFIEDALGKDIRKYFTKDFYADHVKRYKKRPIYWQFASPKGSFQALIYMHRYRPDTVSVLLNEYLRAYLSKLEAERLRLDQLADDASATQTQRTKALKDASAIAKQLDELNEWEREVVFPLAQQKIEIDLDAGVKANYPLFGAALKKIPGLEATDE